MDDYLKEAVLERSLASALSENLGESRMEIEQFYAAEEAGDNVSRSEAVRTSPGTE